MFERYTESARRVVFFARHEASALGSPAIETGHFLLALVREAAPLLERYLPSPSALRAMRDRVLEFAGAREVTPVDVDLPLSEEASRALAWAAEEADQLGHRRIGPAHLLLGLLREGRSLAAELLEEHGARLERVREDLASGAGPGGPGQDEAPE
jgi:ATP-dependent Clp protease ATP-binding subunit ClpC